MVFDVLQACHERCITAMDVAKGQVAIDLHVWVLRFSAGEKESVPIP